MRLTQRRGNLWICVVGLKGLCHKIDTGEKWEELPSP